MSINNLVKESLDSLFELNAFEKRAYRGDLSSSASSRGYTQSAGRDYRTILHGQQHGAHQLGKSGYGQDGARKVMAHQINKSLGPSKWYDSINPVRHFRTAAAGFNSGKSGR